MLSDWIWLMNQAGLDVSPSHITVKEWSFIGALLVGMGTLAGVISFLYRENRTQTTSLFNLMQSQHVETKKDLVEVKSKIEECEKDRSKLWAELSEIRVRGLS